MNVTVLVTTIQQCNNIVSLEKDKCLEEKESRRVLLESLQVKEVLGHLSL